MTATFSSSPEPLIWTSRGNLPVSSLKYIPSWTLKDRTLQFCQEYRAADGEVVRRDVHLYVLPENPQCPA